jgi:hypothetical protein
MDSASFSSLALRFFELEVEAGVGLEVRAVAGAFALRSLAFGASSGMAGSAFDFRSVSRMFIRDDEATKRKATYLHWNT